MLILVIVLMVIMSVIKLGLPPPLRRLDPPARRAIRILRAAGRVLLMMLESGMRPGRLRVFVIVDSLSAPRFPTGTR
jgi:hypothetical protein